MPEELQTSTGGGYAGALAPAVAPGLKTSPLGTICESLSTAVVCINDELDMLFSNLSPVLTPAEQANETTQANPSSPVQSQHVDFLTVQTEKLVGIRNRLANLLSRVEV